MERKRIRIGRRWLGLGFRRKRKEKKGRSPSSLVGREVARDEEERRKRREKRGVKKESQRRDDSFLSRTSPSMHHFFHFYFLRATPTKLETHFGKKDLGRLVWVKWPTSGLFWQKIP